jgi:hypothetical protein
MGLEEYFTKAITIYKGLEKKTESNKREMREILKKYQLAKDYGEINTPTQQRLDSLFYDIRKELR